MELVDSSFILVDVEAGIVTFGLSVCAEVNVFVRYYNTEWGISYVMYVYIYIYIYIYI